MKNPNVFKNGIIEGRMHKDSITGMLNVDWSDGHREVYMTLGALRAAGITVSTTSKYSTAQRRYTRRGNVLHIHPIQHKTTTYGRKSC